MDLLFNPNIMVHYMATYKIKEDKLDDIEKAITEFVGAVRDNEPSTILYASFHRKDDPLSFVHFMCFENEDGKNLHESADYTKKFVEMLSACCTVQNVFTELDLVRSNKVC